MPGPHCRTWLKSGCHVLSPLLCLSVFVVVTAGAEPWSTYRGNLERTGNTDGQAGPKAPKVLWAMKTPQNFIAAPVPFGERLYLSGVGAFNVSTFFTLAVDPSAGKRTLWTKTTPYLKLPTVCSPAVSDGKLVFGDGMHQTDGAILHCLRLDTGMPLWEFVIPGTLVHLEGAPTVAKGRVYIGGGAAGVLCLDLNRLTLDGKEMTVADIQPLLDAKWKELVARYEKDRQKDPDFAVPPNEDQLPKPAPVKLWQQGADKWHVDAPVTLAGNRLLVASAFLDKEKVGDRALLAVDAATGNPQWRTPLAVNPWGGPSVSGTTIVVSGSTVGYDPRNLARARGEVAAFNLDDGKLKWRKELKGGAVSCAAIADNTVVVTATDGKIRALDLLSGDLRWYYEGLAPFLAAPAVAGGTVYAGDLKGVIHALSLADGKLHWTFDLGNDPAVGAPGMVYGGPVLQGGRLFVATCNLEGPFAGKPTAVVCLGDNTKHQTPSRSKACFVN